MNRILHALRGLSSGDLTMTKKQHIYRYRSAVTGRWVTPDYARRYPRRTVRERVR